MLLIESPARVLYHLEAIDIENDEYLFWDADGNGARITVKGRKVSSIDLADNELSLKQAFGLSSKALGLDVDTNGTNEEVWARLKQAEDSLPRPRGFFSRIFRRSGE